MSVGTPPGCLNGMVVIEIAEGWTAAAVCGRLLSELGATVYKIETPQGDVLRQRKPAHGEGDSCVHRSLATNKRSLCIDPSDPGARGVLDDLLRRADVALIDPFAVDGLGAPVDEACRAILNPRLIAATFSAYGASGPLAGLPGGELIGQALGGIIATTGHADEIPHRAGAPIAAHGSAVFASTAILAALFEREDSGLGQSIDAALYDAAVATLYTFIPGYFISGKAPPPQGNRYAMSAPWNAFPARDGWITVSMGTDKQWQGFLAMIGRGDLVDSPRYRSNDERTQPGIREEVEGFVTEYLSERSMREGIDAFTALGIPSGPILSVAQLMADENFRSRDMVQTMVPVEGASYVAVGSTFKMSDSPGTLRVPSPALGAHTIDALRELCGYASDRIDMLRRAGTVRCRERAA